MNRILDRPIRGRVTTIDELFMSRRDEIRGFSTPSEGNMSEMREESATNGKVGRRGEERREIFESVVGLFVRCSESGKSSRRSGGCGV